MSPERPPRSTPRPPFEPGRFAARELPETDVLIYDREEETAWVRSDAAIELDAMA